ncbi:MAG: HlyD family secretion protein [Rickettsiales bacterium]
MDKKKRIALGVGAAFVVAVAVYFIVTGGSEHTDDAFIEANVIPMSPKVSGYVTELNIDDNTLVKKGDVLLIIDPRDYQITLDGAQAQYDVAQSDLKRKENMNNNARSIKDLEAARAAAGVAKAAFEQAQKNLADTQVVAPDDGVVTRRGVELGSYVQPGQLLFSIVTPKRWVVANFKETQLEHMRAGQKATISVDAYPNVTLHGKVDSIQHGTGSRFSAFPAENATGNYVKIIQRVPVKITLDDVPDDIVLGPGMSVIPTVDTDE